MRRVKKLFIFVGFSIILSSCSVNENVAELYEKENPLSAEVILPDTFIKDSEETVKVILTQNGQRVEDTDFVHFEIWKQDESVHYDMEEAIDEGNGVYSMSKSFEQDGLYSIKVHASSGGSLIMPQAQFIVGELSDSEWEFLQKGTQPKAEPQEHHH